jgi:hypothetical protein
VTDVCVGQVWTDRDPRIRNRRIQILALDAGLAACRVWKTRRRQGVETVFDLRHVWISVDRLPRGYRLVEEVGHGR